MSCATGYTNIVDSFLNPDGTSWTGSITYTLIFATTVAGATIINARQVVNVSNGLNLCLAPGLYTVAYNQSGQDFPVSSQWNVPSIGGPYTIAEIYSGSVAPSLTVTGPFLALGTVTMASLVNAAARPYVSTDSSGLLGTGNLAAVGVSGSAADLIAGTVAAARGGAGTVNGILKANGAGLVTAATVGTDYAAATNGTSGQFLTSDGLGGYANAVSATGTGLVVRQTSPTLTTPALGTPSSLVLTNATGLPAAAMPGLTGDVTSSAGSVATTVGRINGTALSALATGLLKNTTATGVPSIAVAGTDLIGGVSNLTTVGGIPFVSATGILNQNAADLFWDTTNKELGIRTAVPDQALDVRGNVAMGRRASGNAIDRYIGLTDTSGGVTGSRAAIQISQNSAGDTSITMHTGAWGSTDQDKLTIAANDAVGIGPQTTSPNATLQVKNSIATTGSTSVNFNRGAAQTASSTIFTIDGVMAFAGTNTTGAGSAALGANSPAVTNTAPYTWIRVVVADGSTAYIPVWK